MSDGRIERSQKSKKMTRKRSHEEEKGLEDQSSLATATTPGAAAPEDSASKRPRTRGIATMVKGFLLFLLLLVLLLLVLFLFLFFFFFFSFQSSYE